MYLSLCVFSIHVPRSLLCTRCSSLDRVDTAYAGITRRFSKQEASQRKGGIIYAKAEVNLILNSDENNLPGSAGRATG